MNTSERVRPSTGQRKRRVLFATARIAAAVALVTYLIVSGGIDWSRLRGLLSAWPLTLAALVLLLFDTVLIASRLCVLLEGLGLRLTLLSSIRLSLVGLFFNTCLPGSSGGDAVKIYYAVSGNAGRRTEIATIVLLDRAVGLFTLLLWPLLAAMLVPGLIAALPMATGLLGAAAAAAGLMVAALLAGFSARVVSSTPMAWLERSMPLGRLAVSALNTVKTYRARPRFLVASVAISLMAHTVTVAILLLIAEAVHPQSFTWRMAVLIPLGLLANTIPLTPGGIGFGEAAFEALFSQAGLAGGAESMIGWRLLLLMVGLLGLVLYLQGHRRLIHDSHQPIPDRPARETARRRGSTAAAHGTATR